MSKRYDSCSRFHKGWGLFSQSDGSLHAAGQDYGQQLNAFDFWPGPLADNGNTTVNDCSNWNQFFIITKSDLQSHLEDYANDLVVDSPIPASVKGWPANGNPFFEEVHGFPLPQTADLAPFYDRDNDGIYDPSQGDYPISKGDRQFWWVYNDNGGTHAETGSLPVKMEVQAGAFAWNDVENVELSTFYEYKFIYKGSEVLNDFYIALWVDPDLGCWADDYIGALPGEQLAFVYNGDDNDENCNGLIGYQTDIPVLGIKMLKPFTSGTEELETFSGFTYYFNTNAGQPLNLTDPATGPEFYNYMSGKWKDGTPFSEGGNGYNPGAPKYPYVFDSNPSDDTGWNECTNNSLPGDRRFLMSYGPLTLNPGDISELAFAVIWLPSQHHPCPDVTPLIDAANQVKEYWEEQTEALFTGTEENAGEPAVRFAPNPMTNVATLSLASGDAFFQEVQVFSSDGRMVSRYQGINGNELTIQRNSLPNGSFFYKAILSNGKIAGGKFMIGG